MVVTMMLIVVIMIMMMIVVVNDRCMQVNTHVVIARPTG